MSEITATELGCAPPNTPTWPEVQALPRKRKPPIPSRQETQPIRSDQAATKEIRQMQLWETRSRDHTAADSSPAWGHSTVNPESLQMSDSLLQQIHRWLEESTQEEIQEIPHLPRWTGLTLLRTLNTNKRHSREQQRRDRHYLHGGMGMTEAYVANCDEKYGAGYPEMARLDYGKGTASDSETTAGAPD